MSVYMADVSDFQTNVDAVEYLKYHKSIIMQAGNSERLQYLRKHNFTAIGIYQYLESNVDPIVQAREFISFVGHLHTNEFPILDCETGIGSQVGRVQSWLGIVDQWCNFSATLYSYVSFFNTQLGGSLQWPNRPIWLAAYGQPEPTTPHELWQYTDRAFYGAITPNHCDSSIYHGTDEQFIYTMRHGRQ